MSVSGSALFTNRPQVHSGGLWSFALTWLIFLGVSLVGVRLPGVNEPHYLCKARALSEPGWCGRDFFLQSVNVHVCFLELAGWLTERFSFSKTALLGRVVSAAILAWGWFRLSDSVLRSPRLSAVSAGVFAVVSQLGNFSGEWILGGFESKVPAWGLGWAAIGFWISGMSDRRLSTVVLGGICCGLSVALHPVVGGWFGLGIAGAALLRVLFDGGLRREAVGLGVTVCVSVVAALPGLIPALRFLASGADSEAIRERALFIQVYWRLRHHLDPTAISSMQWLWAGSLVLVCVAGFVWQRRRFLSGDGVSSAGEFDYLRRLQWVMLAALSAACAGVVIGWHGEHLEEMRGWQQRAEILRFYPFRFFDGLLPGVFAIVLTASGSAGVRGVREWRWAGLCLSGVLGLTAVCLASGGRAGAPGGYSSLGWGDWQAACEWLRLNTPTDALVLTPRESFAFKWYAERAEYVSYKDCPQDAAGIVEWDRRLWGVHRWSAASLADGRYDGADLDRLRLETGCDYVLIRGQEPFDFEPVWSGEYWRIYSVQRGN